MLIGFLFAIIIVVIWFIWAYNYRYSENRLGRIALGKYKSALPPELRNSADYTKVVKHGDKVKVSFDKDITYDIKSDGSCNMFDDTCINV